MKVIDSTIIIDFLKGKPNAVEKIAKLEKQQKLITTQINVFELFYGEFRKKQQNKEAIKELEQFFSRIAILDLDFYSAKKAAEIFSDLEKKGEKIDLRDALIAATILSNDLNEIISLNKKHFSRISKLTVEEY